MTLNKNFLDFDDTMKKLTIDERDQFLDWIASKWIDSDSDIEEKQNILCRSEGVNKLRLISTDIRNSFSQNDRFIVCKDLERGKLFVDEFVYDDKALELLRKEGLLTDHFCSDCGSPNVKQFELLSHSCSIDRVELIFEELLGSLKGKAVLDIGSGVGAILYGAHTLSLARKITGVEVEADLFRLCHQMLNKHNMTDRVTVVHADIATQPKLISEADAIFVCNTFEYFKNADDAINCWRVIYQNVSSGAVIVLSPPAHQTFLTYPLGVDWKDWLNELPLKQNTSRSLHALASIAAYKVLNNRPALPSRQEISDQA